MSHAVSAVNTGLFIEAGFTNVDYVRGSPYHPDPEWNRSHDAWIFQYKK